MSPLLSPWLISVWKTVGKIVITIGVMFSTVAPVIALSPTLVDLGVNDTKVLNFTTGVNYLLVLDNDNPHGTSFYFGEFAQSVLTQYLQGAANVSQDSLTVPSNAKVLWLFSPTQAGEFEYYAVNGSSDQKGDKGKIKIKLAESTQPQDKQAQGETQHTVEAKVESAAQVEPKRRWLKGGRRD